MKGKSAVKKHQNGTHFYQLTNPNLVATILEKAQRLSQTPQYALKMRNAYEAAITSLADIFAWCRTEPGSVETIVREEYEGKKTPQQILEEGRDGINRAWGYANAVFQRGKQPKLSSEVIKNIATLIDPRNQDYRPEEFETRLFENQFRAPLWSMIPEMLDEICATFNSTNSNPIDKANFAHIATSHLQPFMFGNKRLARLLQYAILHQANLPPGTIYPGELDIYGALIKEAVLGFSREQPKRQIPFFNYVGGKVNTSLDHWAVCIATATNKPK